MTSTVILKCDKILEVRAGSFKQPELELELEGVDVTDLAKELVSDTDVIINQVLEKIYIDDIISFLEDKGYTVTE